MLPALSSLTVQFTEWIFRMEVDMSGLGGYTQSDFIDSGDCHPTIDEMSEEELAEYLEQQEEFEAQGRAAAKFYAEMDLCGFDLLHEGKVIDAQVE
jgi:hypothetical protein